jgi:hypothetical protein
MRASTALHGLKPIVLIFVVSLSSASAVTAQTPSGLNDTLAKALRPGMTVWITDSTDQEKKAQIVDVSPSIVVTDAKGDTRHIGMDEVMRIRVPKADSVLDGALIGTGIATVAVMAMCTWAMPCVGLTTGERFTFAMIGAGAGLAVDAAIQSRHTIFDRRERSVRLHMAPILDRRTRGVQLSLSF